MQNINRLIFFFSIVGLAVSAFLAYEYLQPTPVICPITGNGCELVRNSEYSAILGISIPYIGVLFYTTFAFISIWLSQNFNKLINNLRALAALFAVLFGVYLTYLEAYVINAYCFWCVCSFIVSIVIFVLTLYTLKGVKNDEN